MRGGKGDTIPRAPIHYGDAGSLQGRRITAGGTEKSQQCHKYFLNTVNLLSKELGFDHRGAKPRPWGRRFDQGGAPNLCFAPGAIKPRYAPGYR